jgi:hypothetical protein
VVGAAETAASGRTLEVPYERRFQRSSASNHPSPRRTLRRADLPSPRPFQTVLLFLPGHGFNRMQQLWLQVGIVLFPRVNPSITHWNSGRDRAFTRNGEADCQAKDLAHDALRAAILRKTLAKGAGVRFQKRFCRIAYEMVAGRQVFRHPCL